MIHIINEPVKIEALFVWYYFFLKKSGQLSKLGSSDLITEYQPIRKLYFEFWNLFC